ncbi:hypothetical protein EAI72_23900 [Escherichia coli]|nr:hypothetical protein EAI72_23900 [Escherichia coli]
MMLNDYFSKTLSIAEVKCHCNAYVTHLDFDVINDYFSKTLSIAEVKCHCNAYVTHLDFDVLSTLIDE